MHMAFPIFIGYTIPKRENKRKHTAIPASPFTKVTASHGNASMTAIETAAHKMLFFLILIPHAAFDGSVCRITQSFENRVMIQVVLSYHIYTHASTRLRIFSS